MTWKLDLVWSRKLHAKEDRLTGQRVTHLSYPFDVYLMSCKVVS